MKNKYLFKLYIHGHSTECDTALHNLKNICQNYIKVNYEIIVIDIKVSPHLAEEARLIAIPTLVKESPAPSKRIVGDLCNVEKVLSTLGINL